MTTITASAVAQAPNRRATFFLYPDKATCIFSSNRCQVTWTCRRRVGQRDNVNLVAASFTECPEKSDVHECGSRQTPIHPRTIAFRFCSLFHRQCAAHRPRERPRAHRLSSRVPARVVAHGHARPHAASTTERRRRRAVRSSGKHRTAATHVFHFTREEFARPSPVRARYPRAHRRMRVRPTFLRMTLVPYRPVWKKMRKFWPSRVDSVDPARRQHCGGGPRSVRSYVSTVGLAHSNSHDFRLRLSRKSIAKYRFNFERLY